MKPAVLLGVVLIGAGPRFALAQPPLFTDAELAFFGQRILPAANPQQLDAILGDAAAVLRTKEKLQPGQYRPVSLEAVECVLQRASDRKLSVAQLFTDARFGRNGGLAIAIDGRRLQEVEKLFDLHSLFPVRVDAGGRTLRMRFLLAGHGRLFMSYDGGGTFTHPEKAYQKQGGRYELAPFIRMNLETGQRRGFAALGTLPRLDPGLGYGDFIGPKNSRLRALWITPKGISVSAELPWWLLGIESDLDVKPPPITRRLPLTSAGSAALRTRGCPTDAVWGSE